MIGAHSIDRTISVDLVPAIASVRPDEWNRALGQGDTNVVFMTHEWQQAWWDVYGRGTLLLATARRRGELLAIAPLFDQGGVIYFVGSGGSDYLDFVGDVSSPTVLDSLLAAARDGVDKFIGFRFCLVPEQSRTATLLERAAERLALNLCDEGAIPAPTLDLESAAALTAALNKKSARQAERFFEGVGGLGFDQWRSGPDILPHMDDFFEQHVTRWASTRWPSLFLDAKHRRFYNRLVAVASDAGWIRFTRLTLHGRAIATHFGFCHEGRYIYYKPAYALDMARHSPGQLLLRRLLVSAIDENADTFDFGIGDEPYKRRFATAFPSVRTWGLYAR